MDVANKNHKEKKEEQIRRLAGTFVSTESNHTSLITITRAEMHENLRKATVFATILPESAEKDALNFLKRQRSDFREYVKKHSRFKNIPSFDFEIDQGEKNRQHLDEISNDS